MTASRVSPRVSFVVLAFNQQDYIEAAIASAEAQDYPDLQIVLSDDGSSDATVALMERAAREYTGPHDIIVNRTPANRGVVQHFYHAFGRCDGDLIVAAGGDDISHPHRVSTLVEHWRASGADALYSAFEIMEADGSPAVGATLQPLRGAQRYFPDPALHPILGMSAAYDRRVFECIDEPDFPAFAEDFFFFLMLGFRSRRIAVVDDVLVRYRRHNAALSHRVDAAASVAAHEATSQKFSARGLDILRYAERCIVTDTGYRPGYGETAAVDLTALRSDIAYVDWQSRWMQAAWPVSIARTLRLLTPARARWLLPRMFGVGGLALVKRLRRGGGG